MEWLAYIAFLVIGLIIGMAIGYVVNGTPDTGAGDIAPLQAKLSHLDAALRAGEAEKSALTTQASSLTAQLNEAKAKRDTLQSEVSELGVKLARAQERITAFGEAQEEARAQFANLANDLLKKNSEEFKTQSKESLEHLLNPLDKQLNEFKTEITGFKAINEKMTSETASLTNALTKNVKAQGNWGEFVLERILEESGLEKGRDYTVQGEGMDIKSAEGGRQMPDIVINLPDEKHIVIDSKVSLKSFQDYQNADNEADKLIAAKAFVASTEAHIKDLAAKEYQNAYNLQSLDFVMMFMPIEAAFFLLLSEREDLLQKAWEKNISIVSPANLFPNLRTIGYLWRLQRQNENVEEIARLGGTVYDKVHGFLEDMKKVGKAISTADDAHKSALNKLSDGRGSVVKQAEKLKDMGAKTTKSLPDLTQN